jgi:hypothetical protein
MPVPLPVTSAHSAAYLVLRFGTGRRHMKICGIRYETSQTMVGIASSVDIQGHKIARNVNIMLLLSNVACSGDENSRRRIFWPKMMMILI